jgi:menaquinone-dependent protoporphyrinogen oxidase
MKKALVVYASKYGSTAEIAATIGNTLSENGLEVKVASVDAIRDIDPYNIIVIGSAVYAGHWMANAVEFLERNVEKLAQKPVWVFSSGPTGHGDPSDLLGGWRLPENLQPTIEQINPRSVTVFHGKIDPERLHWGERLMVRAMRGATGDFRDWAAIREWALTITGATVTV